ncbi:MAG: hypothetical protein CXZ00_02185 [Acidobacteria bacterium]|nr:MAG: hypothetical protein CXZ00_02185 [Acidobacteriota bacterium]
MNSIGPLLIVFVFCYILFLKGKALQKDERKRLMEKKLRKEKEIATRDALSSAGIRTFDLRRRSTPQQREAGIDSALMGGTAQGSRQPGLRPN